MEQTYKVLYGASASIGAIAAKARKAALSGKHVAQVLLPDGNRSTGTKGWIATHKRPATRNGVFHGAAGRDWEVLDSDGSTVIGTFTVDVGQVATVVGASFIQQVPVNAQSFSAEDQEVADSMFGDLDDLPDAPEQAETPETDETDTE